MKQLTLDHWLKRSSSARYAYFDIRALSQVMLGPFKIIASRSVSPIFNLHHTSGLLRDTAAKRACLAQPRTIHHYFGGGVNFQMPTRSSSPRIGCREGDRLNTEFFSADHAIYLHGNYGYTECNGMVDDNVSEYIAVELKTQVVIGSMRIEDGWLDYINVLTDYHRNGIGANFLRLAVLHYQKDMKFPYYGEQNHSKYYLSKAGLALVNSCLRQGIITREQCNQKVPQGR